MTCLFVEDSPTARPYSSLPKEQIAVSNRESWYQTRVHITHNNPYICDCWDEYEIKKD